MELLKEEIRGYRKIRFIEKSNLFLIKTVTFLKIMVRYK